MAVRKQRATTKNQIIENDIDVCVKKAKLKYRHYTDEFFIFETRSGSGYYFPDRDRLNDYFIQHWKFNYGRNRWEKL